MIIAINIILKVSVFAFCWNYLSSHDVFWLMNLALSGCATTCTYITYEVKKGY